MNFVISWIVATISATGYAGIAGLMALESACIPLPSEIIMPFGGYLASTGRFSLVAVATAGAIGCNIGSTVAYLIGAHGGRVAVLRWGKYIFLDANELDRFDRYFKRYGSATVLIGRLLPVVRTFISLPAGIARMPFIRFQIFTFIGSWPWCFALAYLGLKLGEQWNTNPEARAILQRFNWIVTGLLVCAAAIYIYRRWRSGAQQVDSRRF
jgi:membrane protein DedA with SNARE-associated domain